VTDASAAREEEAKVPERSGGIGACGGGFGGSPPIVKAPGLPEGVLAVRVGPGANCSSAGSAIDILFYGSVFVGAIAVALAAAFPPRDPEEDEPKAPPPPAPPADADQK
jgi:hypothetical protein